MLKNSSIQKTLFLIGFIFAFCIFSQNAFASAITGIIYDNGRVGLPDVDVELLNDYYQQVNRTRTDGSGRYEFSGLVDGRYTVRVLPFRYDLEDQSQQVEIFTQTIAGRGAGNQFLIQDFYLQAKKGSLRDSEVGVIFAQEIPKEAQVLYEQAVKDIAKKHNNEAILALRQSLEIFPKYYLALYELGKELFIKENYEESAPLFLKAVEVNPKSAYSFYYLGNSLYKLNYTKAAIKSLTQAYILAPSSAQVLYMLGKVERSEGDFVNAEKHLVEAKKSSKVVIPDIQWELALLYGNNLKRYKEAADELESYMKSSNLTGENAKTTKKLIGEFREKAKNSK